MQLFLRVTFVLALPFIGVLVLYFLCRNPKCSTCGWRRDMDYIGAWHGVQVWACRRCGKYYELGTKEPIQ